METEFFFIPKLVMLESFWMLHSHPTSASNFPSHGQIAPPRTYLYIAEKWLTMHTRHPAWALKLKQKKNYLH